MKSLTRSWWSIGVGHASLLVLLSFTPQSPAQDRIPVVTVHAVDSHATWSGDPGMFLFFRDGPTNAALNIFYHVGGTASNGVDYAEISNWVSIPAGVRSNVVTVAPIDLGQTDVRTVEVHLIAPPILPPVNYAIGIPSAATVFISPESITNIPPWVQIALPPDGSKFVGPADIPICAQAGDPDGFVSTVEFFAGDHSLGVKTNNPVSTGPMNPFCLIWSNVPPGVYELHALATDNGGATARSAPVTISVGDQPPPTNLPPLVRITSPPNGAMILAPADIPIFAFAKDLDDTVATVEFFDGTTSLGLGSNVCITATPPPRDCPTNVFTLIWSNAPVGPHILRTQATDSRGASSFSEPVFIAVRPPPPPETNRPAVVSIIASDPIAIEGTNCWPWLGLTNSTPTWTNWPGPASTCRWFTNCGPKNATFVVRRLGATNDDLTVSYAISGTASNGVDYLPLSGSVTIPAGDRRAFISIVPIDDGPPDISSTVVLRLLPSSSATQAYLLGFPRAAAALIVDGPWPHPGSRFLGDRCFHLNASGPDGAWFRVEYSTDMTHWLPICDSQVVSGSIDFVDPDAGTDSARFYRTVPEMEPPAQ